MSCYDALCPCCGEIECHEGQKTFALSSIPAGLFPIGVMTEDQVQARPDWAIFPEEKKAILALGVGESIDHDTVRWTRQA